MIIQCKYLPVKGFAAMNIFGMLLVRKGYYLNAVDMNHERIHTVQMREMGYLPFYIWYVIEWLIRCCRFIRPRVAYRNISFEREAYEHQKDLNYLKHRKHYAFLKWITNKKGG